MTDRLKRINELAKKQKESFLTADEREEQKRLREEYIKEFRANLRGQLDNIVLVHPDGEQVELKELRKKKEEKK